MPEYTIEFNDRVTLFNGSSDPDVFRAFDDYDALQKAKRRLDIPGRLTPRKFRATGATKLRNGKKILFP